MISWFLVYIINGVLFVWVMIRYFIFGGFGDMVGWIIVYFIGLSCNGSVMGVYIRWFWIEWCCFFFMVGLVFLIFFIVGFVVWYLGWLYCGECIRIFRVFLFLLILFIWWFKLVNIGVGSYGKMSVIFVIKSGSRNV